MLRPALSAHAQLMRTALLVGAAPSQSGPPPLPRGLPSQSGPLPQLPPQRRVYNRDHNCIGHNYIGHNYIGPVFLTSLPKAGSITATITK